MAVINVGLDVPGIFCQQTLRIVYFDYFDCVLYIAMLTLCYMSVWTILNVNVGDISVFRQRITDGLFRPF